MHRKGGDARFIREHDRAAVALMHVAIDNEDAGNVPRIEKMVCGDAKIIEDAKPFRTIRISMVGASSDVHGYGA